MRKNTSSILDIIIIGRNEGWLLNKALDSAKKAAEEFHASGNPMPRVIYVDGQSTDGSQELVKNHSGVENYVVEGSPTPPAGRRLGSLKSKSKYVFFMDGDMEVYECCLVKAVEFLEKNEVYAGVGGTQDWEFINRGKVIWRQNNFYNIVKDVEEVVGTVGGAMVYRREALDAVGNWDPTMTRHGEFELYIRLLTAGYKLVYINIPFIIHRDIKTGSAASFLGRCIFTKNIFIPGVVARKAKKCKPVLKMLIKVYWLHIFHPLLVAFIIFNSIFVFKNLSIFKLGLFFVSIFLLLIMHYKFKNGNIIKAILSLFTMNFYSIAFLIGFVTGWPRVGGGFNKDK